MKGAPQRSRPVSIHLERHRRFVERRFNMPTANVGKNGTPRLASSGPDRRRSIVLPFERHDEDE
jgi:hypothetical protein